MFKQVKSYSNKKYINSNVLKIYGISQNPNTNDYIMVLQDEYCEKCGKNYSNVDYKWCKSCQTSRIGQVDNLLLIPYNQFNNIKEIGKGGFATVYLATWTTSDKKVALKCLHNSQNITKELLNEV